MIVGSPLYYNFSPPNFQHLNLFETPSMADDLMIPQSPNSVQSDSENSISSVEINQFETRRKNEVQCCWRSCGIKFDSLDQLATHVSNVHAASGPGGLFYCGWEGCTRNNRGFNARYKMLVHVRTHTNEKPHQCFQCEKSFSRAENLKIHTRSHSGEKPYVCPVVGCNKAYSNSSDRFKHTRTHQVDKPYQCKVPGCPKRYTDPSSLRKHVKTYKHFVGETKTIKQTETKKNCDCSHNCYISNCLSRAAELINLGAFMNNFQESGEMQWNKIKIFTPYDLQTNIDGPLDLSIKH
ncbi:PREDICTED: zinc finger protein GLIS2 homolog [Nicrophorus vespilloides]|uniref:Zinc finger protein GLIS2 homolog n=1 Tax=Nicrophorus vespilloides TaxID=110193 RepID=A0ABM1NGD1_NICVS|nr:PREDICTED: zinc finger protein GLIS2 homolog [Nicrophorus vespilloides]